MVRFSAVHTQTPVAYLVIDRHEEVVGGFPTKEKAEAWCSERNAKLPARAFPLSWFRVEPLYVPPSNQ